MNSDLNNLYNGGNSNPQSEQPNLNNNTPQNNPIDLNSLYNNNPVTVEQNNNNDISVDQAGLNKMYNQETKSLDDEAKEEPKEINNEPVVNVKPVNEVITEEDLQAAYIDKNVRKLADKPFNFAAFFFGIVYLFYRKMYVLAILYYSISYILSMFINPYLVAIGLAIIIGVSFNPLYMLKMKVSIEKIKNKNKDKPLYEIKDLCREKGGSSFISVFLGVPIIFGLMLLLAFATNALGIMPKVTNNETKVEESFTNKIVPRKDVSILDEYDIVVPEGFYKSDANTVYQVSYSTILNNMDSCNFTYYQMDNYDNAEKAILEMAEYYAPYDDDIVTKSSVNDIDWFWFKFSEINSSIFYYATNKNGKVYLLTYKVPDKDNVCFALKDELIRSIKVK